MNFLAARGDLRHCRHGVQCKCAECCQTNQSLLRHHHLLLNISLSRIAATCKQSAPDMHDDKRAGFEECDACDSAMRRELVGGVSLNFPTGYFQGCAGVISCACFVFRVSGLYPTLLYPDI